MSAFFAMWFSARTANACSPARALHLRSDAWQVGSWAEIPFKEPLKGYSPAFSPDGKLLVVETGTGVARLLDPKTGKEYARLEDPSQDRADEFSFSPDSTKLVCGTVDGHCLHVWDLPGHAPATRGDGVELGRIALIGPLMVWRIATGERKTVSGKKEKRPVSLAAKQKSHRPGRPLA